MTSEFLPPASEAATDEVRRRLAEAPTPYALVRHAAAMHGERPALRFIPDVRDPAGAVTRSFVDVAVEVDALAAALRAAGVGPGDGVAVLAPTSPEGVTGFVAASAVGVAFPLNPLLSAEALAPQMALARVRALLVALGPAAPSSAERLQAVVDAAPGLALVVAAGGLPEGVRPARATVVRVWESLTAAGASALPGDPDRLAALLHTGGTTGAPKLARLTARNLAAGAWISRSALGFLPEDTLLLGLPLFHVGGLVTSALAALAAGAQGVFPGWAGARDPMLVADVWRVTEAVGASILAFVPTSLGAIVQSPRGGADLWRLRGVVTGAAALSPDLARRLEALTERPVAQVFGMTEMSGICTAQPLDGRFRPPAVGYPAPLVTVELDGGEVVLDGPNVFDGYLDGDGAPQAPSGPLHSGDLGERLADGQLRLTGRRKDVIIRSGHNIDPAAIEEVALTHPHVAAAAAVGMPDAYAGEVPILFVVPRSAASLDPDALLAWLTPRIPEPPARPRRVKLVDSLPTTAVGKLSRLRLRQMAVELVASEILGVGYAVVCEDPLAKTIRIVEPPDSARSLAKVVELLEIISLNIIRE